MPNFLFRYGVMEPSSFRVKSATASTIDCRIYSVDNTVNLFNLVNSEYMSESNLQPPCARSWILSIQMYKSIINHNNKVDTGAADAASPVPTYHQWLLLPRGEGGRRAVSELCRMGSVIPSHQNKQTNCFYFYWNTTRTMSHSYASGWSGHVGGHSRCR